MSSKTIAIITARGGSKRIPRKNIRLFLGRPIIHYVIEAALSSGEFDEVMVSTEDREIAEIAKEGGAQVPFLRSEKTAGDFASTSDVIEEVFSEYAQRQLSYEFFACLYPAAPFITAETLRESMRRLKSSSADSVYPVTRFSFPIQRALRIQNEKLEMIHPENLFMRSQDLEPAYHDCGQFYGMRTKAFLEKKRFLTDNTLPFIVPESEVQDIDNEEDWKIAEMKYRILRGI